MEKNRNRKRIIAVVLTGIIALSFVLIPIGAVDEFRKNPVTGLGDPQYIYIPCDIYTVNSDYIATGVSFNQSNDTNIFEDAMKPFVETQTDGGQLWYNVPIYPSGIMSRTQNAYRSNGVNKLVTADVSLISEGTSTRYTTSAGNYGITPYEYSLSYYLRYIEANDKANFERYLTEGIYMTGGGFAINLADELVGNIDTVLQIDGLYPATDSIVTITRNVMLRDVNGQQKQVAYTERVVFDDVNGNEEIGGWKISALDTVELRNRLTIELPAPASDYFFFIESYETYINLTQANELNAFKVTTHRAWSINGSTAMNYDTTRYNTYLSQTITRLNEGQYPSTPITEVNFLEFMITAVDGFLQFEIGYGITLGGILATLIGLGFAVMFLKYFAGG